MPPKLEFVAPPRHARVESRTVDSDALEAIEQILARVKGATRYRIHTADVVNRGLQLALEELRRLTPSQIEQLYKDQS